MFDDREEIFDIEPDPQSHADRREQGDVRTRLALQMLKQMQESMAHVVLLLEEGDTSLATRQLVDLVSQKKRAEFTLESEMGLRAIEGVFEGQAMVASDGVRYVVPENYASKSKLVEGDMLKLIVKPDGRYVFKQIGPVERRRVTGMLQMDSSTQQPVVVCDEGVYNVLAASVSYFKGIPGDEATVVVSGTGRCVWAALERIERS